MSPLRLKPELCNKAVEDNHRSGGPDLTPEDHQRELLAFSDIRALTPGGVAWKIAKALDFWETDEEWPWWRHMLQSALYDAIEMERARAAGKAVQP